MAWDNSIRACSGAEVNILADGTYAIRLVRICLQSDQVQIVSKDEFLISPDQINNIDIEGPLAITFSGKGVLIRKTTQMETFSEQNLRQLFPGVQPEEFYLQHFKPADSSFISFIRKEVADTVISAFKNLGAEILLLSLGPFALEHIISQVNSYGTHLIFDGHQVTLDEDKAWLDYEYEAGVNAGFDLKIDIEPIPEHFVLAYASAFQLLLNDRLELITVESEEINQNLLEFLAKLKFKYRGMLVSISFFFLLLLNLLLLNYYNNANQELAGKVGQRSDLYIDRQKLEAELKEKERQVKLIGWNQGLRYAYLCDLLGETLPPGIVLHELNIGRIKEQSGSQPGGLSIRVSGQSTNVYLIHDWIYALRKQPWLKAVLLEKYIRDEQKDTQVFTLLINY